MSLRSPEFYVAQAAAHRAVIKAVRDGRLTRQPCERCDNPVGLAHHHLGYEPAHWLDVQWLCVYCHNAEHAAAYQAAYAARLVAHRAARESQP